MARMTPGSDARRDRPIATKTSGARGLASIPTGIAKDWSRATVACLLALADRPWVPLPSIPRLETSVLGGNNPSPPRAKTL